MADRVGQQLGNYRLLRLIGRGSIAEVYLGEHLHLNTQAAIKVLHTHLTSEASEQLRAEARTMARLTHPHIVRTLDFDVEDGIPFLIMEYAPNGTLRERHPKGTRVPLDVIVSYVRQVAEALHYIHQQKLIHRDVKPESMLLGHNHEVLLTEFNSAIILQSTRSQPTLEAAGTVAYMAPEQLRGKPRPASDQYALGIVVYEWLSGEPPFSGSIREIANQHLSAPPPPLRASRRQGDPAVEPVVLKALAKDPQQRFAHVQDFAIALEEAFHAELPGRTRSAPASEHPAGSGYSKPAMRNLPTGTVTLLFTNIEGSTHLLQQLGDHYATVLNECRRLLHATFQEWNGHEVNTQDDAFFVAFARATDAVLAVVEVQRALAAHPWPEGVAVCVRMGLHTGEPSLTPEGYVGLDVQRAARIMSAAHGGQVLLSQTTANLVEQDLPDDVSLRDLGEHRLKDLVRSRRLFQLVISDLPADFPPLSTLDTYPNNLPVQFTPFIGREQELSTIQQLLLQEDMRLVTLTGPGGTGKTRLGLQVAAELTDAFADGVFFVNLAPISDPALVVPTIAETLSMREGAGQSLLERLRENLRPKQMLLLLDNFEQVVSSAAQVVDLLAACPRLKLLVTSREVLHVQAEHEFVVPPLPLPDLKHLPDLATLSHNAAVALFIQRTQAVKPDFQLTNANARAIVEVCTRLDGLPLAIELAAARMKLLPPQALLARLGQSLQVLTGAARDVPARQQTLRNTIAWSYNLLDAQEQQLFQRLSAFVGGCALEAIEAVYTALDGNQGAGQVLDRIASLIDKSLLQQTEQEGEELRFAMLETIRAYGLEALAANGEMETMRQAHTMYYVALAEKAEPELGGPQQAVWLERLEREHDNLHTAKHWLQEQGKTAHTIEMALRLGGVLAEGRTLTPEQARAARGSVMMPVPPSESPSISPTKSPPTYPGGLTAREVEVLRLLAQGLTDAQIAEQLVIAPRTVNNHLTSIYSKIQVSSRSAATRYAIEHRLA
jgi:predicted ATPase/class 3 adenylate cyclase/DNA-binding CsgD family transcriptional regulator